MDRSGKALAMFFSRGEPEPERQQVGKVSAEHPRMRMVDEQIVRRGVRDAAVLRAMRVVPRERFVPPAQRRHAYRDRPLPLPHGQTISQPYVVALMISMLQLRRGERVLEIGTGSGYQTALLSELGAEVYSVEVIPELAVAAGKTLRELGYDRARIRVGDGRLGWERAAPFAGIIVSAAPRVVPPALIAQLAAGGRLLIPLGRPTAQDLFLITRNNGQVQRKKILPVRFVPLTEPE